MNEELLVEDDWVPASCTLPTEARPLRRSEFDDLFAKDVEAIRQSTPLEVHFDLRAEPEVAGRAAALAVKETGCCSFFRFNLTITDGKVAMVVATEALHENVLAALTARAQAMAGSGE